MLIITRKPGQRIIIGDNIFVDVLNVKNGQIRLGITCPKNIIVDREEIRAKRIENPDYKKQEPVSKEYIDKIELELQGHE